MFISGKYILIQKLWNFDYILEGINKVNKKWLQKIVIALSVSLQTHAMANIEITNITPTPLFPKIEEGQPLKQLARLSVSNTKEATACKVRITIEGEKPYNEYIGIVAEGESVFDIHILDIQQPKKVSFELFGDGKIIAQKILIWQPQKKWTIYCVSYCHQDLGFGDYPHRLRTTIRHANIRLPLQYCRETDDWSEDEKYRFTVETSEPITSYIGFFGKEKARELARRIREGRIEVGGLHNTAHVAQYSHELIARQFYLTARHTPDLLNVKPGLTVKQDDDIGLTWPLATYAKEAGFEYLFHGYNRLANPDVLENGKLVSGDAQIETGLGRSIYAAANEPAFFLQGPDGSRILTYAASYATYSLQWNPHDRNESDTLTTRRLEQLITGFVRRGWPFSILPSQDATDFNLATRKNANRIHKWNAEYSYPHLVCATWHMYYDALKTELKKGHKIKTLALDVNNQWTDQDATDAKLLGKARIAGEAIPTTEKLAALAQMLSGGGATWTDLYQAYHRLMQYHEHTNGKFGVGSSAEDLRWYETELAENREMVTEAFEFQNKVRKDAQQRLSQALTRKSSKNLIVFNPLSRKRTDIVRSSIKDIPPGKQIIDDDTDKTVEHQRLPDNTVLFIAENIPATGYKTFSLKKVRGKKSIKEFSGSVLENDFYRMEVDRRTGAISSLFDKEINVELVDQGAPHRFNGYLYQRFEKAKRDSTYQHRDAPTYRMKNADVSIHSGPVADVVTIKGKAEGAREIRQTVILYHQLKRIDFGMFVNKSPSQMKKEGVYVAFPFNVPDFTLRHELPGAVMEPFRQQVKGSCTAHYAIRSFTDVSNDKYGITVSPIESPLICYGRPRPSPILWGEHGFDRSQEYPKNSRIYLYLMNNMFDVNIPVDQQGPVNFHWAIRSHAGDWKVGQANQFGRQVLQPMVAWRADGKNKGTWPGTGSFMTIDKSNIMCSTIKPAETNGQGMILRFNETTGKETSVTVSLPVLGTISRVTETNLVEENRGAIALKGDHSFFFKIKPFGVKTIRVICEPDSKIPAPFSVNAVAVADMQVELNWKNEMKQNHISHFNIYRDTNKSCNPELINYIGQAAGISYTDKPTLNHGGWIRSTLEPESTYYYRVVAVDRFNNTGIPGEPVKVTTLNTKQKNLPPVKVEGVRAILVSPITAHNFVNILFRTSCESDVAKYEIHRSMTPEFTPIADTKIGVVRSDDIIKGSSNYGKVKIDYPVKDFDHAMYADLKVEPDQTYYYKVCAVDEAGNIGEFSKETFAYTDVKHIDIIGDISFSDKTHVEIVPSLSQKREVRFTTNKTEPTIESLKYKSPFTLNKTTTVKAAIFEDREKLPLSTVDKTFYKSNDYNVIYNTPYSKKWPSSGHLALVDNAKGALYTDGFWQGFEFQDMDLIIDLKKIQLVSQIKSTFLGSIGAWIFLPQHVEFFVSTDSETFVSAGKINTEENLVHTENLIKEYSVNIPRQKIRYIKVFARNQGVCPPWHAGAGGKAWLFVDEIIVE